MQVAIKRGTEPEDGGDHRTLSPKVPMTEDGVTRMPYRYAVGLMIKTDEVSEQLCPQVYKSAHADMKRSRQ